MIKSAIKLHGRTVLKDDHAAAAAALSYAFPPAADLEFSDLLAAIDIAEGAQTLAANQKS